MMNKKLAKNVEDFNPERYVNAMLGVLKSYKSESDRLERMVMLNKRWGLLGKEDVIASIDPHGHELSFSIDLRDRIEKRSEEVEKLFLGAVKNNSSVLKEEIFHRLLAEYACMAARLGNARMIKLAIDTYEGIGVNVGEEVLRVAVSTRSALDYYSTPYMVAIEWGELELSEKLYEFGADPLDTDGQGLLGVNRALLTNNIGPVARFMKKGY